MLWVDPDFRFVPRHGWFGRQDDCAVVPAELRHLRVNLRIKPVRPADRGLEIIDDQSCRDTTEIEEAVFHGANKALGGLAPGHFRITLARMAQHQTKDMRTAALAVLNDKSSLAQIDL